MRDTRLITDNNTISLLIRITESSAQPVADIAKPADAPVEVIDQTLRIPSNYSTVRTPVNDELPDIDSMTYAQIIKTLDNITADQARILIAREKNGKNRAGIIDWLKKRK